MKLYSDENEGYVLRYRMCRLRHGIRLRELGEAAKLTAQAVSKIELGNCTPTERTRTKLLAAMETVIRQRFGAQSQEMEVFYKEKESLFDKTTEKEG